MSSTEDSFSLHRGKTFFYSLYTFLNSESSWSSGHTFMLDGLKGFLSWLPGKQHNSPTADLLMGGEPGRESQTRAGSQREIAACEAKVMEAVGRGSIMYRRSNDANKHFLSILTFWKNPWTPVREIRALIAVLLCILSVTLAKSLPPFTLRVIICKANVLDCVLVC